MVLRVVLLPIHQSMADPFLQLWFPRLNADPFRRSGRRALVLAALICPVGGAVTAGCRYHTARCGPTNPKNCTDRLLLTPRERGMADAEQPLRARGFFALALDGHKRKVDSLTSNIGHLLWSGIADQDKAESCVHHLMSDACSQVGACARWRWVRGPSNRSAITWVTRHEVPTLFGDLPVFLRSNDQNANR